MNDLTIFQSEQFGTVRTLDEDGKILFCGTDVAKALGYASHKDAISRHCKGATFQRPLGTDGGEQIAKFISEGDLYRLITHSRLPAAEAFEKWVFDEVLPTIRKTGQYTAKPEPEPEPLPQPPIQRKESHYLPQNARYIDDFEKIKRSWFSYMLTTISCFYGIPSDTILHYAYVAMEQEGIDIDAYKWWYINRTGSTECSTFEVICHERDASLELADYLTKHMKRICIKLSQKFYP